MGIRNTGKGISVLERYQVTGIFYDKEYKKMQQFFIEYWKVLTKKGFEYTLEVFR